MMKGSVMKIKKTLAILLVLVWGCLSACGGGGDGNDDLISPTVDDGNSDYQLGLIWSQEEWDNTESDIKMRMTPEENLPSKVDLTESFPPIGNQGEYGTCVSWATGYYLKSYLEAKDQGWQPTSGNRQFSPKFLYWMLNENEKNGCKGSSFEANLDILQNTGITTLNTVPYEDLGEDCSVDRNSLPRDWFSEADNYLIENYRKIDHTNTNLIKDYLADGRPVVFGAVLGQKFITWDEGASVLTEDRQDVNGIHARHAMILAGYDDNKGPGGAFLVVNSWGEEFGDNGMIWVDYDFFTSDFTFAAFVAKNKRSDQDYDPTDPDNPVDSEADLLAWEVSVWDTNSRTPRDKLFGYELYNVGERTVSYTERWMVALLYYSAYDPKSDYGICGADSFSDEWGHRQPLFDENGVQVGINYHFDLDTGINMGRSQNNAIPFTIPADLNGYYHFVLLVDGTDTVAEYDESNNILWWTDDPIYILNGFVQGTQIGFSRASKEVADMPENRQFSRSANDNNPSTYNTNAYTIDEIKKLIRHYKESGKLDRKVEEYRSLQAQKHTEIKAPSLNEVNREDR